LRCSVVSGEVEQKVPVSRSSAQLLVAPGGNSRTRCPASGTLIDSQWTDKWESLSGGKDGCGTARTQRVVEGRTNDQAHEAPFECCTMKQNSEYLSLLALVSMRHRNPETYGDSCVNERRPVASKADGGVFVTHRGGPAKGPVTKYRRCTNLVRREGVEHDASATSFSTSSRSVAQSGNNRDLRPCRHPRTSTLGALCSLASEVHAARPYRYRARKRRSSAPR
jgi:hypothetical protein